MEFSELPGSRVTSFGASSRAKPGVLTINVIVVLAVMLPEEPVIVIVAAPGIALLLAASVSVVLPVAGFGEIVAVTPLGTFDAEKVTLLLNPYWELIDTLTVPDAPSFIYKLAG